MKEQIQSQAIYDTKDAAKLLMLHPYTVQRLIREGSLSAKKMSKGYRILGQSLIDYIQSK